MARIPIIMPKMSMTMTEGELSSWLVDEGAEVSEGDAIAEVMTDKVDMEVESTHSGVLVEITVREGMVAVGDPIGYLEGEDSGFGDLLGTDEDPDQPEPAPDPEPDPEPQPEAPDDVTAGDADPPTDPPLPDPTPDPQTRAPEEIPSSSGTSSGPQIAAVPRARGLARERGLDLATISGSGPDGLVTVSDVESASRGKAQPAQKSEKAPRTGTSQPRKTQGSDRSKLIRATVARKMVQSASVPQFTVWRELDLEGADAGRGGLSWTTVLLRAYAAALRDVPELLCRWEDDAARPSGPPAIALAVATPDGLMAPLFTEPDTADPHELDAEVKRVVSEVQHGRLDPAYLGVANGSLSNLGGLGVDRFQALLTPPQASVLALGSIARRPVAVPGGLGVHLTLSAGLTVDHRVGDGAHAAQALEALHTHLHQSGVEA